MEGHTSSRKRDHLRICCEEAVEQGESGFGDVRLEHNALPECDLAGIDTALRFLGAKMAFPLFIAAMTGGHPDTREVNRRLAAAAERFGIGMGVGSQRAALENPDLEDSFTVVRDAAPHAFLCANLGIVQLRDHGIEWAERAIEMIDADAIAIHLNFLQEAIQPEGDHDARGCLQALADLAAELRCPVIVKETGCGISRDVARRLLGAGVQAIDVAGWGGTSWAAVEGYRQTDPRRAAIGTAFRSWGIPTVVSLCEAATDRAGVIVSGGVRSGLDIAKGIALGADLGGMALPLLKPALAGEADLFSAIDSIREQIRIAMFLTGSRTLKDLKRVRVHITGASREMLHRNRIQEVTHGY
ncbi:MAG: type 2 isopentenyl-diphosphate Delta-isomerase [Methanomicrobiales archaeon]|nr:type 2 isopentenyl-diphosphate Delta-isomerase [Methanomicrobiales archaeon]MDI6875404.1 type 2 isopentenyl-diphosphate Delta-isomerase [Methanomicrobiales archaeon]